MLSHQSNQCNSLASPQLLVNLLLMSQSHVYKCGGSTTVERTQALKSADLLGALSPTVIVYVILGKLNIFDLQFLICNMGVVESHLAVLSRGLCDILKLFFKSFSLQNSCFKGNLIQSLIVKVEL
jgi:hypothetical protein